MKVNSVEQIIEEIIDLRYNKGKATNTIVKYLKTKYDLNQARSYELIRTAREKIGDLYHKINKNVLEDAIAKLEHQLERAKENNDGNLELKIQQELNKIHQLHIQQMDITHKGEKITINIRNDKNDKNDK